MKVKEIMHALDEIAPFELAEPWDHSGLRLGNPDAETTSVAVALDPTPQTVAQALSLHCSMLITHHPLMFSPPENLVCDRLETKAIAAAFASQLNVAACHTNLDSARGGVNEHLASLAGFSGVEPLLPPSSPSGFGMGAAGMVEETDADEFCERIARVWNLSGYRLLGCGEGVRKAALCGGAGGGLWKAAAAKGADLYITADMKYHECLEALDYGLCLMVCDHGEMENLALIPFAAKLKRRLQLPVHFIDPISREPRPGRWRSLD